VLFNLYNVLKEEAIHLEVWTLREAIGKLEGTGITSSGFEKENNMCYVTKYIMDKYVMTICTRG